MVVVTTRSYLSVRLAKAARLLALSARAEEQRDPTALSMPSQQLCVAAVMCSVAFLEATINELFLDCVDLKILPVSEGISSEGIAALSEVWPVVRRNTVLDKFHIALRLGRRSKVDRGESVWGDATTLIQLRNTIVHASSEDVVLVSDHPKWPVILKPLERQLKQKFRPNPWFEAEGGKSDFFSMYLGSPCAQWAADTAARFATDCFYRLGLRLRSDD